MIVPSDTSGWIARQFTGLSTGLKMLLILSVGLFPLGLIAILASVQSAQQNRTDREDDIQELVELSARELDEAIDRHALTIRAASSAIAAAGEQSPVCERTLARLAETGAMPASFALYGAGGRLRCASPAFTTQPPVRTGARNGSQVLLTSDDKLRLLLFDSRGAIEAIGEFPRSTVMRLTEAPTALADFRLELRQDGRSTVLHDRHRDQPLARTLVRTSPVAGGKLQMQVTAGLVPMTLAELLLILLPVVMWVAAAAIGWLIVDRLLLRPLVGMQRAVAAYRPGDLRLALPALTTPAREIRELGQAFDDQTRTVARHEAELEAAVDRQTRLVREVHHRVKNNLQVVASLLNLHSRASRSEDVAAAYASIQRRVDALAVVHRNHFAELEENRGVALKPLISELGANLRATAPKSAAAMSIGLSVDALYVTQDTAVSIAFLITEIVEFAMFCGAPGVRISVTGTGPGSALLSIESESLRDAESVQAATFERFDRIVTGLSRQLRSAMTRDAATGAYSLSITVAERADD